MSMLPPPKAQVIVSISQGEQITVQRHGVSRVSALGYLVLGLIMLANSIVKATGSVSTPLVPAAKDVS